MCFRYFPKKISNIKNCEATTIKMLELPQKKKKKLGDMNVYSVYLLASQ